jgi:hypothetical protein
MIESDFSGAAISLTVLQWLTKARERSHPDWAIGRYGTPRPSYSMSAKGLTDLPGDP